MFGIRACKTVPAGTASFALPVSRPYVCATMLRLRNRPSADFIGPCLPSPAKRPPDGPGGIHENKADGFGILARRGAAGVRLFSHWGRWVNTTQGNNR